MELIEDAGIPLRIGIHTGDIVYNDDGAYGDGVNIASRIESLSVSGGVLISEKVNDELRNHSEFSSMPLGLFELKNVDKPVQLFAVTNQGLNIPSDDLEKAARTIQNKSIAVLPFRNMSSDIDNEYFSQGITEEIINELTKINGLNVTARTSSFEFKERDTDVREIGNKLGVSALLEGSVRKSGNRVRITAQLVKVSDGFHIFSEVYDRDLKDIFEVQDEIARKIGNQLRENFVGSAPKVPDENPSTENLEAYDLFLKGRFHLYEGSIEGAMKSLNYLNQAIELAPDFAKAYALLSTVYSHHSVYRIMDSDEAYALAKKYAEKALELDENLVESYFALAHVSFVNEWDFTATEKYLMKARQLSPGNSNVHSWLSMFYVVRGKKEDVLIEAKIAHGLDPISPMSEYILGTAYLANEDYSSAIEHLDKSIKILPLFQQAHILRARAYLHNGEIEKAIEYFNNIPAGPNRITIHYGALAICYSELGDREKVEECLEHVKEQEKTGKAEFLNWSYSLVYLAMNDTNKMFHYLEKSLEEKVASLIWLGVDPLFKPYRQDPRFVKLMTKYFGTESGRIITLRTDTKESLEVDLAGLLFIEAEDNYSRIVFVDDGTVKEKTLRVTLKNIEEQISSSEIFRCHRSYVINLGQEFELTGKSGNYKLTTKLNETVIPVSRSKEKELVEKLR